MPPLNKWRHFVFRIVMAGKLITRSRSIIAHLNQNAPDIVKLNAARVLLASNKLIPQPGKSRGYATGALRASGHVLTDNGNIKPYNEAIKAAIAASDGRILKRQQIDFPAPPRKTPHAARAKVCYPLDYAAAIHDGFYHRRAGRFIIGTAYLISAINEESPRFFDEMETLVRQLEDIHVLSDKQKEDLARIEGQERELAHYKAGQRKHQRAMTKEYLAQEDPLIKKRQKGETMTEWRMRLKELQRAWERRQGYTIFDAMDENNEIF